MSHYQVCHAFVETVNVGIEWFAELAMGSHQVDNQAINYQRKQQTS